MDNVMEYKGYYAKIRYSDEDQCFYGRIEGLKHSIISFEGETEEKLRKDFENAIEEYLQTCKELNWKPEKQYKGSFNIRIEPSLHQKAAQFSKIFNMSLNQFVEKAIREKVEKCEKQ